MYGTGKKKLSVYLLGVVLCVILTSISFLAVLYSNLSVSMILAIIFISAILQFIVQVVCFLRLNTKNEQSRMNLMSFIFMLVILFILISASLWIMWSLRYCMTH
ncbi:MAG: cytochrome o ubiquinol oxidase subunit IV [Coxiella-like endosymbiont]|uniref:cytochrome o ubiquinol oxidase subunit IV n=1 Tax=Coxiella-like endosymbiont TaxID=1592897 RepID=UPI00215AB79C|nr:cytochrome o ubiquinol oxidase subunit IV [Coxiella-like endosymbiont]UVE59850.1 cytochrome o ubiquinol oxidase subunit IV [Coxiella-like endosymbiont]